jgi:hypothetical protein
MIILEFFHRAGEQGSSCAAFFGWQNTFILMQNIGHITTEKSLLTKL